MGIPDYNLGQVELMEAKVEAELGRADEPLTPDSYGPGIFPGLRPWECPLPGESGEVRFVLTPWVEEGPDYLAITRDVVGG